jgi:hypothetical protein
MLYIIFIAIFIVMLPAVLVSVALFLVLGWPGALIGWTLSLVWGAVSARIF